MSKRSPTETISRILWAFIVESDWTQARLAKELGINVRALRVRLLELVEAGVPLSQEADPPQVWWSVPKGWLPDGVVLDKPTAQIVLRFVARSPASPTRDALMKKLLPIEPGVTMPSNVAVNAEPEEVLTTLEDSIARRVAVQMRYFTSSKGIETTRHVSVQRVVYDAKVRFVAFCHRARSLRWFRASGVRHAFHDEGEPYVLVPPAEVLAFVARSVGGYADDAPPRDVSFIVCGDDARWVAAALPSPDLTVETCPEGIRVRGRTSGILTLARYVAGLGGAAIVETPELAACVADLARGTLARARAGGFTGNVVKARGRDGVEGGRVRSVR